MSENDCFTPSLLTLQLRPLLGFPLPLFPSFFTDCDENKPSMPDLDEPLREQTGTFNTGVIRTLDE